MLPTFRYVAKQVIGTGYRFPIARTLCSAKEKTVTKEDLEKLVKNNKVVVFMKGDPEQPRCGFSNAVVQILRMHGVTYDSHDVLSSDDIRQGWYLQRFSTQKPDNTNCLFSFQA